MEVDNLDRLSQQTSQTLSEFGESTPEGSEFVIQDYFIRNHREFNDDYSSNSSETSDVYQEENNNGDESEDNVDIPERNIFQDYEIESLIISEEKEEHEKEFLEKGCGCGYNCIKNFKIEDIMSSRLGCKDCDVYCDQHVNHQHILLQGALNALCRVNEETKQKEHAPKIRKANYTQYSFRGVDVCRKFFMFVFGCGIRRLRNVKSHFLKNGVEQRSHQNTSLSSKCFSVECRIKAVTFIKKFCAQNALILPGRLPAYRLNTDLNILPCSMSKSYIFDLYKKAAEETDIEIVGKSTWYDLWNTFCANIVIQKPKTDLCNVCQKQTISLEKMQGLTEEEKREKINESLQHLDNVTTERAYYNTTISQSLDEINNSCFGIRLGQHEPRSYSGQMHYSFDFAQFAL
ncbi:uncharacterized protein LOC127277001 [Leptopilina boulardi]|uniref:uncharacterized protein LOC127277001 n=1 Tax=Leptopilina boulardi TaxID=63433 RepID=UPI0021F5ED71|nr:uncharacterized protein LOC127277001 [Leptopilina boulardi]